MTTMMMGVWDRFTEQLDRIPSRWGLPLLVVVAVVVWVVVLKLMGI